MRDTGVLDYSVHSGDSEKWTDLRNLQKAKSIGCGDGVSVYVEKADCG